MSLKISTKYKIFPYLVLCFLLISRTSLCNDVRYVITPIPDQNLIEIQLTFKGDDATQIHTPITWTGHSHSEIINVKSEVIKTKKNENLSEKKLKQVVVTYQLKNKENRHNNESEYNQDQTHFRFTGDSLITPATIDPNKNITIKLDWKNLPPNWVIANSFGIHTAQQNITTSLQSLRKGLYVGGEFNVLRCSEEKNAPYVIIKESDTCSSELLLPLLHTIVQSQRAFWNDYDFPHSLITILPANENDTIYAQAFLNAFIAFLPPFGEEEWKWEGMTWVLTHEYFHTWVPYRMMPTTPHNFNALSWFTEGFVEYYTAVLSHRTKTLSLQQCIKEINNKLYSYYTSPFRNVSNKQLEKDRWNDTRMKLIPYQRGCLFALLWDAKIQQKTNGANTLDNVMLLLLQMTQDSGKPFSLAMIEDLAGIYIGSETKTDIQSYIIKGDTIVPPDILFGIKRPIHWMEDIGFHLLDTKKSGYVKGVIHDRNAFKAGLRDGQQFKKFYRTKNELLNIVIIENRTERLISYPSDEGDLIPQYVYKF